MIGAVPNTGGENLGLTTDDTEMVWGSDGGASEMATFFFFVSPATSSGLFLFLLVVSAIMQLFRLPDVMYGGCNQSDNRNREP